MSESDSQQLLAKLESLARALSRTFEQMEPKAKAAAIELANEISAAKKALQPKHE